MDTGTLAPIDRASLRDRAYGLLLRAIIIGQLEPGQRLRD
jgi:DNA-binding GntR family transcriptional regulator